MPPQLSVKSAPTALIGCYTLTVLVKGLKSGVRREFAQKKKIITMLFNPWCDKDSVYLGSEDERKEYVMEDVGLIWRGSYKNFHAKKWNYGQFDLDVREVVFQLLQDHIKAEDSWNPIKVSSTTMDLLQTDIRRTSFFDPTSSPAWFKFRADAKIQRVVPPQSDSCIAAITCAILHNHSSDSYRSIVR